MWSVYKTVLSVQPVTGFEDSAITSWIILNPSNLPQTISIEDSIEGFSVPLKILHTVLCQTAHDTSS